MPNATGMADAASSSLDEVVPMLGNGGHQMTRVAVVAHAGKSFGGGLAELREVLAREGFTDPLWYEVAKSRKAPKYARRALTDGAEVIFVWGGDGMVQRCIDAVAGTEAVLAILPAGTANLLAANLHVPADLTEAVRVGLHGDRRPLDTGARNLSAGRVKAVIEVDGQRFFKGRVSCVLAGNVGKVLGGVEAFHGAHPDDGLLELGVVTAGNAPQWARTLGRVMLGEAGRSPFVHVTRGRKFRVRFDRQLPYELDGGARPAARKLRIKAHPASVRICVPAD